MVRYCIPGTFLGVNFIFLRKACQLLAMYGPTSLFSPLGSTALKVLIAICSYVLSCEGHLGQATISGLSQWII